MTTKSKVAGERLLQRARHSRRRFDQTLAVRIIAAPANDGPYGAFDLSPVGFTAMEPGPALAQEHVRP